MVPVLAATLRRAAGELAGQDQLAGRRRPPGTPDELANPGRGQRATARRRPDPVTAEPWSRTRGDEILAAGGAADLVAGLEEALADPAEAPHRTRWQLLLGDVPDGR